MQPSIDDWGLPTDRNIAKCRQCGDVIESKHRHDFVSCRCGAISLDGGMDLVQRRIGNRADFLHPSHPNSPKTP